MLDNVNRWFKQFGAAPVDAAALGSFVAQRFPESGGARQCAKIAMASYLKRLN